MATERPIPICGENLMLLDTLEVSGELLAEVASGSLGRFEDRDEADMAFVCAARELVRARERLSGLRNRSEHPDRALIAQMAATLLAPLIAVRASDDDEIMYEDPEVQCSVECARAILAEVDRV